MKVSFYIRKVASKHDLDSLAGVSVRVRGKGKDLRAVTKIKINPNHWDSQKGGYKNRVAIVDEKAKVDFKKEIDNITNLINENYTDDSDLKWLLNLIEEYYSAPKNKLKEEKAEAKRREFLPLFDEFLEKHPISDVRKKNYRVVYRALKRYELYVRATKRGAKAFVLDVDEITSDTLRDVWSFFENEYRIKEQYPHIYDCFSEKRVIQKRGKNTLIDFFTRFRVCLNWCVANKRTKNRPFSEFILGASTYGTPYYITLEERDIIHNTDLSASPNLAIQRDIFIFQSLIGCRVGDLAKMTKSNIINDAIEYIPRKTKGGRPVTVRVPLNTRAKAIIEHYADYEGGSCAETKLFPFISDQKYNVAIKEIFKRAGIVRMVTVINATSGEEEKRSLCDIASSHLARRTFIGNLYKKVKDPNLVGALSGHKEGSKAFARYREIDDDIKRELVDLLD